MASLRPGSRRESRSRAHWASSPGLTLESASAQARHMHAAPRASSGSWARTCSDIFTSKHQQVLLPEATPHRLDAPHSGQHVGSMLGFWFIDATERTGSLVDGTGQRCGVSVDELAYAELSTTSSRRRPPHESFAVRDSVQARLHLRVDPIHPPASPRVIPWPMWVRSEAPRLRIRTPWTLRRTCWPSSSMVNRTFSLVPGLGMSVLPDCSVGFSRLHSSWLEAVQGVDDS